MSVLEMARELAKALQQTPEYRKWREALARVEENVAAQIMFRDFRQKQAELQKAILAGEAVGQEKAQELQRLYEIASYNPVIRDLFAAEQQLEELLARIQRIIVEAVEIRTENREGESSHREGEGPK